MYKLTKIAGALLGVVATMGVAGVANANSLSIIPGATGVQEAIGDAGGSSYPSSGGAATGAGLPTNMGGWPNNYPTPGTNPPGFALDAGPAPGGGLYGISGWDGSYLNVAQAGQVTFQYMGSGNATGHDIFQVWTGAWTTLFDNTSSKTSAVGIPFTSGPTDVHCTGYGVGESCSINVLGPGLLAFQFVNLTTGLSAINDGTGNARPEDGVSPGYFLGMDPYLATGKYDSTGNVAYAGFTDLGCTLGGACDHDYQDLVVRASVPEPGTTLLLAAGLMGLAYGRRRQS